MNGHFARLAFALLLLVAMGAPPPVAHADERSGQTSTEKYARERVKEFSEIAKAKPTYKGRERQLEILVELARAPSRTAQKFLFGVVKKKSSAGDHRLLALDSLLRMADASTFAKTLSVLQKSKDATLWQRFSEVLFSMPSDAVSAWAKDKALASKHDDVLCGYLGALFYRPDPTQKEAIQALTKKRIEGTGTSIDVVHFALQALARMGARESTEVFLLAAKHADARVRLAVADALAAITPFDGRVLETARQLLLDDSVFVQRAMIRALGVAKREALAEELIAKLADKAARTRYEASRALEAISGQRYGLDAKAWADWLAKKEPGKPLDIVVPTYHGVPIHGDDVVFLVDASSSMTWPWRKQVHRIDIARKELGRSISELAEGTRFNVIVFSEKRASWKKASTPATSKNKAAAAKWAGKAMAKPKGFTHLYEAIRDALDAHPTCDTLLLLTDGNPTAGTYYTPEGLIASVRAWIRYRRVAINVIGLSLLNMDRGMPNLAEKPGLYQRAMSGIAAATGGIYKDIVNEPK